MTLTQKETTLLKDMRTQEQLCVDKYQKYASQAHDEQLRKLFSEIGTIETQHVQTLDKILACEVPQMNQSNEKDVTSVQQVNSSALKMKPTFYSSKENKEQDNYLCTDALSTEKHVSGVYNTCIFEFKDSNVRDALNHIQKEEQQHGEQIYNFMSQCGMYS